MESNADNGRMLSHGKATIPRLAADFVASFHHTQLSVSAGTALEHFQSQAFHLDHEIGCISAAHAKGPVHCLGTPQLQRTECCPCVPLLRAGYESRAHRAA